MNLDQLKLTLIGCRKSLATRGGCFLALFEAKAPDGAAGHLAYEYAWDKRDVMRESVYTNNKALAFESDESYPESPSVLKAFAVQETSGQDPESHRAWAECSIYVWGDK